MEAGQKVSTIYTSTPAQTTVTHRGGQGLRKLTRPAKAEATRGKRKGDIYKTAKSLYSQPTAKPKPEVFIHHESFQNMDIDPVCIRETKETSKLPFPNIEVNSMSLMQTKPDDHHWGNYTPMVDCKHLVVFDTDQSTEDPATGQWMKGETEGLRCNYKNQVGKMSCLDLAQVLFMSGEKAKTLCACQSGGVDHKAGWEAARECYKRRRLDQAGERVVGRHVRCVNVKEEDDLKISPTERHCLECRDSRIWDWNLAAGVSMENPDGIVKVDVGVTNAVSGEPAKATPPKWDHHWSDYVRVERVEGVEKVVEGKKCKKRKCVEK